MMDMLPDEDKNFAYEFIKKLVKAWDPDFTKVTPEEAHLLVKSCQIGPVITTARPRKMQQSCILFQAPQLLYSKRLLFTIKYSLV